MGKVLTFQVTWGFQTLVCLHWVLQEGFETCHGIEMPPCEGARGLGTTSKLWACTSWEIRGRELGELPGHPGPDGVAVKSPGALEGAWQTEWSTYQ